MTSILRPTGLVLLAAVTLAAVTACSGDDSEGEAAATTPPVATADGSSTTRAGTPATTEPPATTAPPRVTAAPSTTDPNTFRPVALDGSVREVVAGRDDLTNFDTAVEAWLADDPGREGVLRNPRGVTLFAPDDGAFTEADVAAALADLDAFTRLLTAHLKVEVLSTADFADEITTADGSTYRLSPTTIGDATIVEADVEATNGYVHVIDRALTAIQGV